jgi:hypothetical protein
MNYWHGQPINTLPPADVQQAANEAITELMGLRELNNRRESYEMLVLSFIFGAGFSGIAVIVGMLLHK